MTDADLRARAETLWAIAVLGDDEGRTMMKLAGPGLAETLKHCFVTGYLAGAKDRNVQEVA